MQTMVSGGLLAALIAALSFGLMLRLGLATIRRWISDSEQHQIQSTTVPWQVGSAALGLALWASLITHGWTPEDWFALTVSAISCGLMASLLLALSKTDLVCRLLPDSLTILLVASGLLFHWLLPQTSVLPSLVGAVAGYLVLWGFAALYERIRGQMGMGRGDFAMFAGLGAWLGWSALPMVLVTACVIGILIGVYRRARLIRTDQDVSVETLMQQQIAFGPALAIAGLIGWVGLV
jgi:leader peptidase (prepilin peptidase)/N-methyltransferase